MNLNFIGIAMSVVFLVYNTYCYVFKKVVYTINSSKLTLNNNKFFRLQLIMNSLNVACLIALSYLAYLNKLTIQLYAVYFIVLFWVFNYLIRYISVKLKYINFK